MSENVIVRGLMVPLIEKINDDKIEEISDYREGDFYFMVNTEGTLINKICFYDFGENYYFIFEGEELKFDSVILNPFELNPFDKIEKDLGIKVDKEKIVKFEEFYYNGCDAEYWMIDLESFLKRNNFQ